MRERFEAFSLSLHPDKTRLIEFGRQLHLFSKSSAAQPPAAIDVKD
jgi:hypothetical protein